MLEVVCNTSPLQYLHQVGLLHLLPALASTVLVPPAVQAELDAGLAGGIDLPVAAGLPWLTLRAPATTAVLGMVTDLGAGEAEVIALALEQPQAVAILDDGVARRVARLVGVKLTGTLGLLLDAKKRGLIGRVDAVLDRLEAHRFRLDPATRALILRQAGEAP